MDLYSSETVGPEALQYLPGTASFSSPSIPTELSKTACVQWGVAILLQPMLEAVSQNPELLNSVCTQEEGIMQEAGIAGSAASLYILG